MKKYPIFCLCFGILVACNGETKTNSAEATEAMVVRDVNKAEKTEAEENVLLEETYEGSGSLAETKDKPENTQNAVSAATNAKPDVSTDPQPAKPQPESTASTKAPVTPQPKPADTKPDAKSIEQTKPVPVQANTIIMSVVPDMMKFDKEVFTVIAGQKVVIELENLDGMQHNLVIIKPGTINKVGAAADALARDPKGAQLNYVPRIPEVLHATKLLNPEEVVTLTFTAPTEPGDYPFVCTFPGHWRMMNGIMKVTK